MAAAEEAKPLEGNPRRRASPAIRGYVYQFWRTVQAWILLGPEEKLYVEGAEDFDRIEPALQTQGDERGEDQARLKATTVQVRDDAASGSLTLGSQKALTALRNFWETLHRNRDHIISYQYVTSATIGRERDGIAFGLKEGERGIELWEECRLAPRLDAVTDKVSRLRTFLLSRGELHSGIASFLCQATLQELWKDLICRFEWLPDEPDLAQIRDTVVDKLIDIGLRRGITVEDCERASVALYARVEDAAIDPMRPALTQRDFATILDRHALVQVPRSAFTGDHNATAALVRGVGPATGDRTTPTVTVLASLTARFLPPIL